MTPSFTNIVQLEVVDSTNRYVADAARAGAPEGLVVAAEQQEAGRGRRGRSWVSPPGSALLCSVLFRPTFALSSWHLVSSVVALSAREAIAELTGNAPALKWPNDLIYGEGKVGGILAESVESDGSGGGPSALVVGIGCNLSWPKGWLAEQPLDVREALSSATTIERETGTRLQAGELLAFFVSGLSRRYAVLDEPNAAQVVMSEYRASCATIGSAVRIVEVDSEWRGQAIDVRDDGRLLVRKGQNEIALDVADVVHLRAIEPDRIT